MTKGTVAKATRNNWLIDATLALGALVAAISSIYFLFLPSNGYQGGRNPLYGVTILFERTTWDLLHTWGGALMIAAVMIHLTIHWGWVKTMVARMAKAVLGRGARMNRHGIFNLAINAAVGLSFLLAALSGVYFMFVTGNHWSPDPMILFSRTTWDLIHTWSGTALIVAAVIHFAIHWRWVTKVTRNMFRSLTVRPTPAAASMTRQTTQ